MVQNGDVALIEACKHGHVYVMELLLQAGADVNAQNEVFNAHSYLIIGMLGG